MTVSSLRALSRKALAERAKKGRIAGWQQMTKDELITALAARRRSSGEQPGANGHPRRTAAPVRLRAVKNGGTVRRKRNGAPQPRGRELLKPLVGATAPGAICDSLVAEASSPGWLRVRWTLSRGTLARAAAAMGTHLYRAVPVLRIFDLTADAAGSPAEARLGDVEIRGDVDHWYLPVKNAARAYMVQLAYRGPGGLFFVMARSNRVRTSPTGAGYVKTGTQARQRSEPDRRESTLDGETKPTCDLRTLAAPKHKNGHAPPKRGSAAGRDGETAESPIELKLQAELVVHGITDPDAELTLLGARIPISRDGAFSQRFSLPEGRQVIAAVVTARNRCHQRTIVLGIERNTKELEP